MIKYGIKIYSNDTASKKAVGYVKNNHADFIEIYFLSAYCSQEDFEIFSDTKISFHFIHSGHGFNIFSPEKEMTNFYNYDFARLVKRFNPIFKIMHAGIGKDKEIFKKNLKLLDNKEKLLIENKPYMGLNGKICFGYSLDQLKYIKKICNLEICFDFAHAIKSALSQNIGYKDFIIDCIKELKPKYFHITGCKLSGNTDEHLNLWESEYDLPWIKRLLSDLADNKDIYLVFETPKVGGGLNKDLKNMEYFRKINCR